MINLAIAEDRFMHTPPPVTGADLISALLPIFLIFLIFLFLVILPQRKERKKHEEMLKSLKRGDEVITSAGIHGVIVDVKEETVILRIAQPNVKIIINKSAIAKKK